jgi:TPR repeat protein
MLAALLAIGLMQSPTSVSGPAQSATATQAGEPTMSISEIPQLEIKGEAGDVEAQVKLARAYQDGNGVSQNERLAAQWYRRAAERGNAIAENGLANMYRAGSGVEKDKQEAVNW